MPAQYRKNKNRRRQLSKIHTKEILKWFLILVFLILFLGFAVRLMSSWNKRVWSGDGRITFAIDLKSPKIVSYQPETGEIVTIEFPENLEINGSFGVGKWSLGSLYELGQQKNQNGSLLTKTLQYNLGLPIDGFWDAKNLPNFLTLLPFNKFSSNFNFFDRLKIVNELGKVSGGKQKVLSAQKIGLVKAVRLSDGKMGFVLDKQNAKSLILREFQDLAVAGENIGVGVFNGTKLVGVGESVAGVLEGIGMRVVFLRTEKNGVKNCLLKTKKEIINTQTFNKLTKLFSCDIKIMTDSLSSPVEFIIGEELARELPIK